MRRALVLVAFIVALTPITAHANHKKNSWCSRSGDYCTSTQKVNDKRKLQLRSFVHTGKVKICVTDPKDSKVCKKAKLRKNEHDLRAVLGAELLEHRHPPRRVPWR